MTKSTSNPKSVAKEAQTPSIEESIDFRHIQRVKEQVVGAGSVKHAARGLRMSEEDIQKILDENP